MVYQCWLGGKRTDLWGYHDSNDRLSLSLLLEYSCARVRRSRRTHFVQWWGTERDELTRKCFELYLPYLFSFFSLRFVIFSKHHQHPTHGIPRSNHDTARWFLAVFENCTNIYILNRIVIRFLIYKYWIIFQNIFDYDLCRTFDWH